MLLKHEIRPYFVFDGDRLLAKISVEASRSSSRLQAKTLGMEYLRQGKHRHADEQFAKCVDVTPLMAHMVIKMLKRLQIPYVVAPYEADPQLVYLEKRGKIDAILSEDSDLLIFGAKTLITKLDNEGNCIEIRRENFKSIRDYPMGDFTDEHLRMLAILSGCDYSAGLPKIGMIRAYRLVRQHRTMDRILRAIRLDNLAMIPPDFDNVIEQARLTFLHQRVYCPDQQRLVMLHEPENRVSFPGFEIFIGPAISQDLCQQIALGEVDPITKQKFSLLASSPMATRSMSAPARTPLIPTPTNVPPTKSIQSYFTPVSSKKPAIRPLQESSTAKWTTQNVEDLASSVKKRARLFIDSSSDDELDELIGPPNTATSKYFRKPSRSAPVDKKPAENKENDSATSDVSTIGSLFNRPTTRKPSINFLPRRPFNDSTSVTLSQSVRATLDNFIYTPQK